MRKHLDRTRAGTPRASGPLESFGHDGLVIARRRLRPRQREFPWGAVIQVALVVTAVKLLLYVDLGQIAYNAKVDALMQGAWYERAGAWIMVIDPVSQGVIDAVTGLFR